MVKNLHEVDTTSNIEQAHLLEFFYTVSFICVFNEKNAPLDCDFGLCLPERQNLTK